MGKNYVWNTPGPYDIQKWIIYNLGSHHYKHSDKSLSTQVTTAISVKNKVNIVEQKIQAQIDNASTIGGYRIEVYVKMRSLQAFLDTMDVKKFLTLDFIRNKFREKMSVDDESDIIYTPYYVHVSDYFSNFQIRLARFKEVFYDELHMRNAQIVFIPCQKALLDLYRLAGFYPGPYTHHAGPLVSAKLTTKQKLWYRTSDEIDYDIDTDPEDDDNDEDEGRGDDSDIEDINKVNDLDRFNELKASMKIVKHPRAKNPEKYGYREKKTGGISKCVEESDIYQLHLNVWNRDGRNYVNTVVMREPGDPLYTHNIYPESLLEAYNLAEAELQAGIEAKAASEALARANQSSSPAQKSTKRRSLGGFRHSSSQHRDVEDLPYAASDGIQESSAQAKAREAKERSALAAAKFERLGALTLNKNNK